MIPTQRFIFLAIATAPLILLISCAINLESIDKKDIRKCTHCKTFLEETKLITAPLTSYDEFRSLGYWRPLVAIPDSVKIERSANIMMGDKVAYIWANMFCFMQMSKQEIEKRFDKTLNNTFSKSSRPLDKDSLTWTTRYTFYSGQYKYPKKDSFLIATYGATFHFDYILKDGDTIYNSPYGDTIILKECLDAEGIATKGNVRM